MMWLARPCSAFPGARRALTGVCPFASYGVLVADPKFNFAGVGSVFHLLGASISKVSL